MKIYDVENSSTENHNMDWKNMYCYIEEVAFSTAIYMLATLIDKIKFFTYLQILTNNPQHPQRLILVYIYIYIYIYRHESTVEDVGDYLSEFVGKFYYLSEFVGK
jgi:hypothetical protein